VLSVVVPTYNEEANIARCLRALEAQTLPRDQIEVIVVDGESTDRTREVASALADKVVTQVSPGVGGARNDGFKLATHSIVLPPPMWRQLGLPAGGLPGGGRLPPPQLRRRRGDCEEAEGAGCEAGGC